MINNIGYDDIIMKDCCSNNFTSYTNYIRPHKRTYLDMLNNSIEATLNKRIDNFKLINKNMKSLENNFDSKAFNYNAEKVDVLLKKNDLFDMNSIRKNLIVKKKLEYDEEKERKWVENYYRIKNAELNKLRFGTV